MSSLTSRRRHDDQPTTDPTEMTQTQPITFEPTTEMRPRHRGRSLLVLEKMTILALFAIAIINYIASDTFLRTRKLSIRTVGSPPEATGPWKTKDSFLGLDLESVNFSRDNSHPKHKVNAESSTRSSWLRSLKLAHEGHTKNMLSKPANARRVLQNDNTAHLPLATLQNVLKTPAQHRGARSNLSEEATPTTSGAATSTPREETLSPYSRLPPVYLKRKQQLFCSLWSVNVDDWWQDHPDWEVADENATHTCFRQINNPERANLLRTVHARQFPKDINEGCKDVAIRNMANVGYGAMMYQYNGKLFYSAHRDGRPFQVGIPESTFQWLYAPEYYKDDKSKNSWASCPTQDHECYFLPVSSCPRPVAGKEEKSKRKLEWDLFGNAGIPGNQTLLEEMIWMNNYFMRPRQTTRQKLYEFMHDATNGVPALETLETPCTWIHVRRADAQTEEGYVRNYYSINDYLNGGTVKTSETVVLLTDDQSAVGEATLLHPEYKWIYLNRTRNRGPVEMNAHIPTQDPTLEMLILLAEQKVAGQCNKGVHGKSSFFKHLQAGMVARNPLSSLIFIEFDRKLKKTRVEAKDFMKDLNARLKIAKKEKKKKKDVKAKR